MVAAIKLATLNRKGRHLSTAKAIALAEDGAGPAPGKGGAPGRGVIHPARLDVPGLANG